MDKSLQVVEQRTSTAVQSGATIWNSPAMMTQAMQAAGMLAKSAIVPQAYQGKVGDCLIAIDMANRMGLSPIMVMQSSQVVKGNFTWKGTACKAMIDSCGRYARTRYVEVGKPKDDSHGYYLEATTKDGEIVKGPSATIEMAKKEEWYSRAGSKWKTMPELMLKYRAAAFFMRTECASLAMGFLTSEEQDDIPTEKAIAPYEAEFSPENDETDDGGEIVEDDEIPSEEENEEPVLTVEEIREKYNLVNADKWLNWLMKKSGASSPEEMSDEQRRAARNYLEEKKRKQAEE